jgi:polyphosphate kinase
MNPIAQKSAPEKTKKLLPVDDSGYLLNRELSWLEFNRRVLEEALDETTPLLERLKFLSIFSTNLDEFFMIRVSGLKEQVAEGIRGTSRDGMTALEQLIEIRARLLPMLDLQMHCLSNVILPQLAETGIKIISYKDLNGDEKKTLEKYFLKNIFPVLTPQAVDVSHPFPYVSNLSLNLGLTVEPVKSFDHGKLTFLYNRSRFVRIKLPPNLPRLIPIRDGETNYTLLENSSRRIFIIFFRIWKRTNAICSD